MKKLAKLLHYYMKLVDEYGALGEELKVVGG